MRAVFLYICFTSAANLVSSLDTQEFFYNQEGSVRNIHPMMKGNFEYDTNPAVLSKSLVWIVYKVVKKMGFRVDS